MIKEVLKEAQETPDGKIKPFSVKLSSLNEQIRICQQNLNNMESKVRLEKQQMLEFVKEFKSILSSNSNNNTPKVSINDYDVLKDIVTEINELPSVYQESMKKSKQEYENELNKVKKMKSQQSPAAAKKSGSSAPPPLPYTIDNSSSSSADNSNNSNL